MKGSSEISVTGNLKKWSIKVRLHSVQSPVLLINGTNDQAQDIVMIPFFQRSKVKRVTINSASHNAHLEQTVKVLDILSSFLLAEAI